MTHSILKHEKSSSNFQAMHANVCKALEESKAEVCNSFDKLEVHLHMQESFFDVVLLALRVRNVKRSFSR